MDLQVAPTQVLACLRLGVGVGRGGGRRRSARASRWARVKRSQEEMRWSYNEGHLISEGGQGKGRRPGYV